MTFYLEHNLEKLIEF